MENVENQEMINENTAVEYLIISYPEIQNEITELAAKQNFAGIIQVTVDHLKSLLKESKTNIVTQRIKMMDWLYRHGTYTVKHIIENLFIRAFGSLKKYTSSNQWNEMFQYLPIEFQQIHLNHVKLDQRLFSKN